MKTGGLCIGILSDDREAGDGTKHGEWTGKGWKQRDREREREKKD